MGEFVGYGCSPMSWTLSSNDIRFTPEPFDEERMPFLPVCTPNAAWEFDGYNIKSGISLLYAAKFL